jgi:hypothetical protein
MAKRKRGTAESWVAGGKVRHTMPALSPAGSLGNWTQIGLRAPTRGPNGGVDHRPSRGEGSVAAWDVGGVDA